MSRRQDDDWPESPVDQEVAYLPSTQDTSTDELREKVLKIFGVFEEELADSIPVNIDLKKVDSFLDLYRENEQVIRIDEIKIAQSEKDYIAKHGWNNYRLKRLMTLSNTHKTGEEK